MKDRLIPPDPARVLPEDPRVTRAIESGYALPIDIDRLRLLDFRFKRFVMGRHRAAAINASQQLTQLSEEIIGTPQDIERKIEKLAV